MTQNETELSEKVQDSEIEVLEGDADADRWTNYGKDRVYLNNNDFSGKFDAYVDLETGEFVCDYSSDFRMEIEDGVATVTKHWSASGEEYSEVVVRVRLWETESDEEEVETGDEDGESEDGEEEAENVGETVTPDELAYRIEEADGKNPFAYYAERTVRPPKMLDGMDTQALIRKNTGISRTRDGAWFMESEDEVENFVDFVESKGGEVEVSA